ncbi:unnamed protein product [Linum tenue]|uniref:Terpene synthase metal-binding domain-containing protein n=1 Tax=Linum tenue TaxID=586396 RepID=A0AAV0J5C5_9ROSI|nr:unnamed protein product [Linum tenue]
MIQTSVKDYNLNLPLKSAQIDAMLRDRATALNTSANPRSQGRDAYLAYISEGIGSSQDWETAMKFQRQNGSLFNSPSATAAAFIHLHDPDSLRYLRSAAGKNGGDIHTPAPWSSSISLFHISCTNFAGNDLAKLAVEDFNSLQSSHRRELQHLMLWLEEKGLDEMRLAKVRMGYCYFSAVATFSDADHSDARVLFSKHALLVSLVDDLFDMFGTHEEILNLVHLFERWDVNGPTSSQFSSELVETLYWAIHSTICENVEKAFPTQGRSVMNHIVELWVEMLKGMLKEAEWSKTNTIPTLEEYSTNATITLGVGAFLVPALYLAGQKLSEEVVKGLKFQKLFRETSNCGRLLNDSRGYEREAAEGKPNAVLLRMKQGKGGNGAEEEAMEEVERSIENLTRQVLEMALDENDYGQVPSEIRDMFWKSIQVFYLFYMKEDLYHASTKLVNVVESVINEPISLHENLG